MPDDDPEKEFEAEDMELNKEDTFKIEKDVQPTGGGRLCGRN